MDIQGQVQPKAGLIPEELAYKAIVNANVPINEFDTLNQKDHRWWSFWNPFVILLLRHNYHFAIRVFARAFRDHSGVAA